MANSFVLYNGNGVTQNFTVPFGYLDEDHVTIQVDDVEVPSTWVNSTTIRATTAPASGTSNVKVVRVTPTEPWVTFSDGSGLLAANLNSMALQNLYVTEEVEDAFEGDILTNLSVGTAQLADSSVTTAKIADLNVTTGKLAADAVTTAKITDNNVTTAKIADLNVTTGKLAADAVTTAKITDLNVTTAKLADLGVTAGKLAADAVTTAKIADANVTQAKLLYPQGYTGLMILQDVKSSGTAGGATVATTWTKRTLNTETLDTGNYATLASDQITLLAGTYRILASSTFHQCGNVKTRLRNTTDGTTLVVSNNANLATADVNGGYSILVGRFTLAATKTLELQYYASAVKATDGLGVAATSGESEIYLTVELIRE